MRTCSHPSRHPDIHGSHPVPSGDPSGFCVAVPDACGRKFPHAKRRALCLSVVGRAPGFNTNTMFDGVVGAPFALTDFTPSGSTVC